jgi:hypothetical protein
MACVGNDDLREVTLGPDGAFRGAVFVEHTTAWVFGVCLAALNLRSPYDLAPAIRRPHFNTHYSLQAAPRSRPVRLG